MIGRPRVAVNYDHWLLKPFGGDFNTAKEHYWQGPYVEGSNEEQRSDARDLCFVCLQEPSVHVSATGAALKGTFSRVGWTPGTSVTSTDHTVPYQ